MAWLKARWPWLAAALLVLGMLLGWRTLASGAYANLAAINTARALATEPPDPHLLARSREHAQRALDLRPTNQTAAYMLTLGALAPGPDSADCQIPDGIASPRQTLLFATGRCFWAAGREDQALALWADVANVDLFYVHVGDRAYAEGEVDTALAHYALAQRIDERALYAKATMYRNLCDYWNLRSDYRQALDWAELGATVDPNPWMALRVARSQFNLGRIDAALVTLKEVPGIERVPPAWLYRGLIHSQQGNLARAEASYLAGLALSPQDARLQLALAELYVETGRVDKARALYEALAQGDYAASVRATAAEALAGLD